MTSPVRAALRRSRRFAVALCGASHERDGDADLRRSHNVSAGDDHTVLAGRLTEAAIERVHRFGGRLGREGERDKREERCATHRRDITQVDGQRLPADVLPASALRQEVDAFDHRVCSRDQVLASDAPDGGVVAGADDEVRRAFGANDTGQALDEAEFAEV